MGLISKTIAKLIEHYKNNNEKKVNKSLKQLFPNSYISAGVQYNDKTILKEHTAVRGKSDIRDSYIGVHTYIVEGRLNNCKIGNYTSIATNVSVQAQQHPISFVSTHPLFYKVGDNYPYGNDIDEFNNYIKCENGFYVNIGNDVWIGEKVIIKGGVTIGDGAIIGMGSVVTKNVPPYSIVAGVPARIIKYRFDQNVIDALLRIKWWDWPLKQIKNRRKDFIDIVSFINKYDPKVE